MLYEPSQNSLWPLYSTPPSNLSNLVNYELAKAALMCHLVYMHINKIYNLP